MFRAAALLLSLTACNNSRVVHLPQTMDGVNVTPHTAVLTITPAQSLDVGGRRLDAAMDECPVGAHPANIEVCVGNSKACAQRADKPPVDGITVLYNCAVPTPPPGGGLGTPQ